MFIPSEATIKPSMVEWEKSGEERQMKKVILVLTALSVILIAMG